MKINGFLLACVFLASSVCGDEPAPDTTPETETTQAPPLMFVTECGMLSQRLVIQDAQSGVVGRAGKELTIEPDGSWKLVRFWGTRKRVDMATGTISKVQIAELGILLNAVPWDTLKSEFGVTDATENPNPRHITIDFGDVQHELLLLPGTRTNGEALFDAVHEDERTSAAAFYNAATSIVTLTAKEDKSAE